MALVDPAKVAGSADVLAIALDDPTCSPRSSTRDWPEEAGQVFSRFFRGSLDRDRMLGGSGLGLTVAQELIEAHGGEIRCASVAGEGSCLSVHLPLAPAEGAGANSSSARVPGA